MQNLWRQKIINENNLENINNISENKINTMTSREDYNNNYYYNYNYSRKTNDNNVNVVKSRLYKTLLAIPQNEMEHINNMEITRNDAEDNNIIYNSDDEITKGKMIYRNNRRNYSNKTYVINKRRYNNYNLCDYNEMNKNKSDIINKNGEKNTKILYNYKTNNISRKRVNYGNQNNNSSFNQIGYSFYRKCSPDDTLNKMCQHQSKSQLKSIVINKNRKRKLFRFEEGKGIKIIYNE